MVGQRGAQPTDGLVTQVSRTHHVARQTLYRWQATGRHVLEEALGMSLLKQKSPPAVHTLVLTLVIETHASDRGMQSGRRTMHGIHLSLGSIAGIVTDAGQRAIRWWERQQATTPRALALDEHDSSQRGNAYLNVIDGHSGHVWATVPPVAVDGERWTVVWWSLQEQRIRCSWTVRDGGRAIAEAVSHLGGPHSHQRDVWHLFPVAAQVQARLDHAVQDDEERVRAITHRAEHEAQGNRIRSRRPNASRDEQQATRARRISVADGVRSLCQEQHRVLEVVVTDSHQLLRSQVRQGEIDAVLDVVEELVPLATPSLHGQIQTLVTPLRLALPETVVCARRRDGIQQHAEHASGAEAIALVAWAWLRRGVSGPTNTPVLQGIHPSWRAAASDLLAAWDRAVRASSAGEHWHSIVRPHMAVHRPLSAGFLSLLAVWHHHRMAPRGLHEGFSPLQRTESPSSKTPWLAAFGSSAFTA